MKVSEMIKKLKQAGCYKIDEGSKHDQWYSPKTEKYFMVPRHQSKELATGTANQIMKDAELK